MNGLAIDDLPDDPAALKSLLIEQQRLLSDVQKEVAFLQAEVAKLAEDRRLDRERRFGASSEAHDYQAKLFDEAEVHGHEVAVEEVDDSDTVEVAAHKKRRPKRKPLPANLPRVDVHHDLVDKACGCCGDEMSRIGEVTSEQLEVIPMQAYVQVHHRPTYSCSTCDESIQTTPMPPQPIPKSYAGAGFLAHVATAKYADGLPLYRQAKQFQRLGVDLPRNTLANHMIKLGELIEPLIRVMQGHVQGYDIVQMDETPVQVLKEPGKVARSESYMWVMKGGPPDEPVVLYHYDPGRSQKVPQQLLPKYAGYLQSDGYAGYNGILKAESITGVGCWAHARRKFMDAKKALPKQEQSRGNKVTQALSFIGKLYRLEQLIKALPAEEKLRRRQTDAVAILVPFKAWLDKQSIPPQTKLGQAIKYTLAQWPRLVIYLEDGRLNIDNNLVENAIRPFAIGRKNWLFSASVKGVEASANLYSLIETAKVNGVNDYAYLKHVFTELPKAQDLQDINQLLPWHLDDVTLRNLMIKPSQHADR